MKENKMGTMPIDKLIVSMSLPIMISMLVQALYNIVDSIFVAKISEDALTAVSMAFPIQNLMIAVGAGTAVGVNALLARSLGEKDFDRVNRIAENAVFLVVLSYAAFLLIGLFLVEPFYRSQTDIESIITYGKDYMVVVCCFSFGIFTQLMFERMLQATGKTVYTMFTQGVGAIINIILDPIFIFGLNMGVRGAALATVISQGVSCAWVVSFLMGKKTSLRLKAQNMRIDMKLLAPCIALGLSAFIMQSTESIISVCFNSSLLKYGGDIAVGAMTILTSVMQFAMLPLQGIAQGAQPISSYNFGAGNRERVSRTFRLLLRSSLVYSFGLWALVQLFPGAFAGLFTNDAALLAFTAKALRVYCGALCLFGAQIACQMTFVSTGNAVCSIIVAILRKFVLLIPLIYLMPRLMADQTMAVYTAEPIADGIAVLCTVMIFAVQFKKALHRLDEART
mgnify:CR=1 FL=1